jgi:hypothetical protein
MILVSDIGVIYKLENRFFKCAVFGYDKIR